MATNIDDREDGLEALPTHVSSLRDMRFEERPKGYTAGTPPPIKDPAEERRKYRAKLKARHVTQDGRFCCSACGTKVVRPPNVSANDWAQRRRCDACVAVDKQPPEGMRCCRECGELFTRKKRVRHGETKPTMSNERFCPTHRKP